jgi:hypothetical protein
LEIPPATTAEPNEERADKRVKQTALLLNVEGTEWDLVSNIVAILATQPGITLQYVRGHQDRHIAYQDLPPLAQLNVDADDMATLYQTSHGRQRPIVLLTDTAKVHLITPEGTVTSRYSTALRFLATYTPLMRSLEERNGWSPQVRQLINWTAHSAWSNS